MKRDLKNKKIAILAADGFEESELLEPKKELEAHGALVTVVSLEEGTIRATKSHDWTDVMVDVDRTVQKVSAEDFDALVLPGGVMNPDRVRQDANAVEFVRGFVVAGKPVAAICHGPWTLVDAKVLEGRTVTSYPSLKMDLINAGAEWVDAEVVVDRGLITSRKPKDLPAFCAKLIEEIADAPSREGVASLERLSHPLGPTH